jgi:hypothetical protein
MPILDNDVGSADPRRPQGTGGRHDTAEAHRPRAKLRRPGFYEPVTGAFASDCLLLAFES